MTTFYDPAKIRELAESGDPFWKGAAWILDQQDAARLARAVDDVADRSEFRPLNEVRARLHARRLDRNADTTDYDSEWTRTPTSADHLGEYEATTAGRLEQIQDRINRMFDQPEVRDAIQASLER